MTSMASNAESMKTAQPAPIVHPLWVRLTHWINAVAILMMAGSGWQIYNASPLFPFTFPPDMTLGGWLAGGLLWHFAGMWLLVANGIVYLGLGLASGRLHNKLLPIHLRDVIADLRAALSGRLTHDDLAVYNAIQKLLYTGVLGAGIVIVASGLAIWKPVQLRPLTMLLGGYEAARIVHFCAMSAIVLFVVIHIVMALIVPKSLRAMILGR